VRLIALDCLYLLGMIASLIRSVDIFRSLTDRVLSRLTDVAEAVAVPSQKIIIHQDEEPDAMYVLIAPDCS
jgi:hypothetical protein